jgi:hypothetical protein
MKGKFVAVPYELLERVLETLRDYRGDKEYLVGTKQSSWLDAMDADIAGVMKCLGVYDD